VKEVERTSQPAPQDQKNQREPEAHNYPDASRQEKAGFSTGVSPIPIVVGGHGRVPET